MSRWALLFGLILVLIGIFGYMGGNHTSAVLMPAYFGILLGVLGATARTGREKTRMVAMHIAATVRRAGCCSQRPNRTPDQVSGSITGNVPRPNAAMVSAPLMAVA